MITNPHSEHVRQLAAQADALTTEWLRASEAVEAHKKINPDTLRGAIAQCEGRLGALLVALNANSTTADDQSLTSTVATSAVIAMAFANPGLGGILGAVLTGGAAGGIKNGVETARFPR